MIEEKKCMKCDAVKPLSAFYSHAGMADGHLNKCKECTKRDVAVNRHARLDYYRERDRVRGRAARPARNERRRKYEQELKRRHGENWHTSHNILNRAIKTGAVTRPTKCEKCDAECKPDGHHDDYSRPLDVRWLCRPCHIQMHFRLKKLRDAAKPIPDSAKPATRSPALTA